MDPNEKSREAIHAAKSYIHGGDDAINKTFFPQILRFTGDYKDYLRELRIASGVIAGAGVPLLASDIRKIDWMIVLAIIFFVSVIAFTLNSARKQLVEDYPYVRYLKTLIRSLTELSGAAVRFINGQTDEITFRQTEEGFKRMAKKNDKYRKDDSAPESIKGWRSDVNYNLILFVLGLALIFLSVVLPLLQDICIDGTG